MPKFNVKIFKEDGTLVTEDTIEANNMDQFEEEWEDMYYNREDEIEAAIDG